MKKIILIPLSTFERMWLKPQALRLHRRHRRRLCYAYRVIVLCSISWSSFCHIQMLRPIAITTKKHCVKVLFTNNSSGRYIRYASSRKVTRLFWLKIMRRFSHCFPPREIDVELQGDFGLICSLIHNHVFPVIRSRINILDSFAWHIIILTRIQVIRWRLLNYLRDLEIHERCSPGNKCEICM